MQRWSKNYKNILGEKMKIKCAHCLYEWNYLGKSDYYCSCPRCRKNISVRKEKEKLSQNVKIDKRKK